MSIKKVLAVATVVAALGGFAVVAAHAQSVPSSASCIASCGTAEGDCASAAAQGNVACLGACTGLRGAAMQACVQACGQAVISGVNACKASFANCASLCSLG